MDMQTIKTMSDSEAIQKALEMAKEFNLAPATIQSLEIGECREQGARFLLEMYVQGGAEKVKLEQSGILEMALTV